MLLGGAGRPLSCTPTLPLPGPSFLAFRLSREPVWTACSTMGLLPTGTEGKPAPELGKRGGLEQAAKSKPHSSRPSSRPACQAGARQPPSGPTKPGQSPSGATPSAPSPAAAHGHQAQPSPEPSQPQAPCGNQPQVSEKHPATQAHQADVLEFSENQLRGLGVPRRWRTLELSKFCASPLWVTTIQSESVHKLQ